MNFPSDLYYTPEHEWIRFEGETGIVGVTDFAQKELGDIVFIDVNSVGKTLKQNDVFGTVEAVKTVSDLFLPLAGEITAVNPELANHPEYVNSDPYGKGWIVKIKLSNPDKSKLLKAEDYRRHVGM